MRNTQLADKVKIVNAVVPTVGSIGASTATVVDGSAGCNPTCNTVRNGGEIPRYSFCLEAA